MSKASYDLGRELVSREFVSKRAKAVARAGDLIGYIVAAIGVLLAAYDHLLGDDENGWIFLLVAAAGILFLVGMRWIAGKLDQKRDTPQE